MKKLYGVIGDPIGHSLSPAMHNQEFKSLGIDGHYQPFRIKIEDLKTAVEGMKVMGISGFNVTIPHKSSIIPILDGIDPLAEAIGAVNTVVREDGRFIGYNTDGKGYLHSLMEDWKTELSGEKALVIGAGGASKAIYFTLVSAGMAHVDICNRSVDKARDLIGHCPFENKSKAISLQEAEEILGDYSLIVQTTPIGMYPYVENTPISLMNLAKGTFVSDIIYNPGETEFLKTARIKGAKTQNGLGMFVGQGALAFELWTGIKPDIQRMKKTVLEQLGGQLC